MRTRTMALLITVLLVALPLAVQAQQLFDFNGQALVPGAAGGTLSMYSVLLDAAPTTTPIPLDFVNFQYTIVIEGLVLDVDDTTQLYSGGTITIFEDAATVADYAFPGTFTDGTAILSGVITTLNRTMFTANIGTVNGLLDWTGGTRLDDIAPEDQLGWPILSGISRLASNVEPGYDENWDGKVEPTDPIVSDETISWGELKLRY